MAEVPARLRAFQIPDGGFCGLFSRVFCILIFVDVMIESKVLQWFLLCEMELLVAIQIASFADTIKPDMLFRERLCGLT